MERSFAFSDGIELATRSLVQLAMSVFTFSMLSCWGAHGSSPAGGSCLSDYKAKEWTFQREFSGAQTRWIPSGHQTDTYWEVVRKDYKKLPDEFRDPLKAAGEFDDEVIGTLMKYAHNQLVACQNVASGL
eukprot:TRINITY_DN44673_c0_g2_i2.p1 TRINITY_DN44673_c0_g2~~TRINITY_DN44673_c0_g2_i2.p1  ORF type:complete len:130 (+),score=7.61 TRINITY_DN44673_c0_g2_i2:79-468(+)